jgi:competence protein ComEA
MPRPQQFDARRQPPEWRALERTKQEQRDRQKEAAMNRVMVGLGLIAALALASNAAAGQKKDDGGESRKTSSAVVNINSATVTELETLPGIGARTAQRILEYRQKNGGFKKIEELMNVQGVGEKSFLKIKDRLTIGTREKTGSGQ